jgi:hypothetical protein
MPRNEMSFAATPNADMAVQPTSMRRATLIALICWLSMLGIDFFFHGGLLAGMYQQASPFLLAPAQAFALIPAGYAAFFLMAVLLVWLMVRLNIRGWRDGPVFGLKLGALMWGALALSLLSISTAEPALLASWFVGQTVEMVIAGAVAGMGLAGARLGRLFVGVLLITLVLAILTIAMQSLGLAPQTRI